MKRFLILIIFVLSLGLNALSIDNIPKDIIKTREGELKIFHVGHASLWFEFKGKVVHVDPFSRMRDYANLPKADLILKKPVMFKDLLKTIERFLGGQNNNLAITSSCS